MQRASQIASVFFAAAGLSMMWACYALGLAGEFGPGPGFFGFGIGLFLATTSAIWLGNLARTAADTGQPFVRDTDGTRRVAGVTVAIVAFAALVERLGFSVSMLALLLFLLITFGREHRILKILLAFAGSFGTHYVFEQLLRVSLPSSSIGALQALGL